MIPPNEPPPESTLRLFVAIPLPAPVRNELAAVSEPLPGVNWTRPEQLHLTLRFLGDTPGSAIDSIVDRLGRVRVEPFLLPVEGIGTFPPNRPPRVVWVGTGSAHPRLFQLRQQVDDALLATGLPIDVRTFHPHITIARCHEPAERPLSRWLRAQRDFAAPPFRVDSFNLYSSELRPEGAVHTVVQTFSLAGPRF